MKWCISVFPIPSCRIPPSESPPIPPRSWPSASAKPSRPIAESCPGVFQTLKMIPLVFAGWLRYLMAVDDKGTAFAPSPDPLLDTLRPVFASCRLVTAATYPSWMTFFPGRASGVNLFSVGLADLVKAYFKELTAGPGAVKATLEKYLG